MGVFLLTDLKTFLLFSKISDNFFGNSSPLQQKGENTQTKPFFTRLLQFNLLLCNNDAIVFIGNFRWVSDFLYFLILLWLIGGKGGVSPSQLLEGARARAVPRVYAYNRLKPLLLILPLFR